MSKEAIEKIKKLLRLSESPNEHEANLALAKAQELALKEGLNLEALDCNSKENVVEVVVSESGRIMNHDKMLVGALSKHFRVVPVSRRNYDPLNRKHNEMMILIGLKDDIETFREIHAYVNKFFNNSWEEFKKIYAWRYSNLGKAEMFEVKTTFLGGFLTGIDSVLTKNEESKALVITKNHITNYIEETIPNVKTSELNPRYAHDAEAYSRGFHGGQQSVGNKQIQ